MGIIKMFSLYNEVKDAFVKPKVVFKCGFWKKSNGLPVWKHGPIIRLYNRNDFCWGTYHKTDKNYKVYSVTDSKFIKCKIGEGDGYKRVTHKLPKGVYHNKTMWVSPIRRKLRKWHLGWIPPEIELPTIFSFHIFNHEVGWKTKYDDYRYEYPGQFTIVIFGISFDWFVHAPCDDWLADDDYWESILWFIEHKGDLVKTNEEMGKWSGDKSIYRLREDFLKEPYRTWIKQIQK